MFWEYDPFILITEIPPLIKNLQKQGVPINPIWEKCSVMVIKLFFLNTI